MKGKENREAGLFACLSAGCLIIGLAGALIGILPLFDAASPLFTALWAPLLGDRVLDQSDASVVAFSLGLGGAYMVGLCVALQYLIWKPLKQGEAWAWKAVLAATTSAFVIDETYSIVYGIAINAIGNPFIFALILVPLFLLRPSARARRG
jgi:hypothetical protein